MQIEWFKSLIPVMHFESYDGVSIHAAVPVAKPCGLFLNRLIQSFLFPPLFIYLFTLMMFVVWFLCNKARQPLF